ncbi:hypothetical protein BDV25DRAFT_135551 [Aspergillus avenaceus]|uniref:Uncharacterized protein n=1 Tax=Aspergillus avenaceus TaxID=36643 RepID=A0A5N6U8G5_ASPAV|nr:hypothetical protein BDV25DRAFT_135551 [Aspergillus avenaceus]
MPHDWFLALNKLQPPTIPKDGIGPCTGPLCPGHILTNPHNLSSVINATTLKATRPDMPIWHAKYTDFPWAAEHIRAHWRATPGLVAYAKRNLARNLVEDSVKLATKVKRLDVYTMAPTVDYVQECMGDCSVVEFLAKQGGRWGPPALLMVTGIVVLRDGGTMVEAVRRFRCSRLYGTGPDIYHPCVRPWPLMDTVLAVRFAKLRFDGLQWIARPVTEGGSFSLPGESKEDVRLVEAMRKLSIEDPWLRIDGLICAGLLDMGNE